MSKIQDVANAKSVALMLGFSNIDDASAFTFRSNWIAAEKANVFAGTDTIGHMAQDFVDFLIDRAKQ